MGFDFRIHPETLRETVADPDALARRIETLAALDLEADFEARCEYATLLRVAGRLDDAVLEAELTLASADLSGDMQRMARAMLIVGRARQWRQEWELADTMFRRAEKLALFMKDDELLGDAADSSGRSLFDQGKHVEAALRFRLARELRRGTARVAESELGLRAAMAQL